MTDLTAIEEKIEELDGVTTSVIAGNGLTGGGSSSEVTLNVGAGNGITVTADAISAKAGSSITVDANGINNAGVRSVTTGDTNGTIKVNTGGTSTNVAVKGLGTLAYQDLDSNSKIPSLLLPSYVDDVLEYANKASFPATGESGKIYIAQDKNITYRWSGSAYTEISSSLALGETSSTAYRGDRGKVAYDHSQSPHAPSNAEANVQSDWSVTDTSSDAYIKNKPTIPTVNNATLTLNVGGQAVTGNNAFSANDATNTTYNVPSATSSAYGVIKVSSVNSSAVTVNSESTEVGRYYPVELNSDGKAIVNVPWTDSNTDTNTSHAHSAGVGLVGSGSDSTSGGTYTYKAKLRSETALSRDSAAATETANRVYPVAVDKSGYLAVNVPWSDTDTDTHYTNYFQIKGNGTEASKFTQNADKSLNFKPGSNVSISAASGEITISSTNTNTAHSHKVGTGLSLSGTGGTSGETTYSANLKSTTSLGTIGSTNKLYAVGVDSNGNLAVNVPWTDTNTDTDTHYTNYFQIKGNGTEAVKFTQNGDKTLNLKPGSNVSISAASGEITISSTDTNTWRGIQNNLTSDSTSDSLSAAQGKVLKGLIDAKANSSALSNYVALTGDQTIAGNKVFTGTTSTMILHTYNPLYIINGTDNSKNTSLYTDTDGVFKIVNSSSSVARPTYNGKGIALTDDLDAVIGSSSDTKVTQAYSTANNAYPLLMSGTAGISSTNSRGDTTAILNNQIYAYPYSGSLIAGNMSGDYFKSRQYEENHPLWIDHYIETRYEPGGIRLYNEDADLMRNYYYPDTTGMLTVSSDNTVRNFQVVSSLPSTTNANTIYFVTN